MVFLSWFALFLLGGALGLAGGLFGIGGGIIAVPVLRFFFGLDQTTAQGTALVMMVPNLLVAWWQYACRERVSWRDAIGVAVAGTLSTWATASLAQALDQALLSRFFAIFLLGLALRMLASPDSPGVFSTRLKRGYLPLVGVLGGACMGLLGVGGGLLAVPLFSGVFGFGQRASQSLGLALVAPSALIALGTYAGNQHVDWTSGLCMALGGMATVSLGVSWAHRLPERRLRRIFAVLLGLSAAFLLAKL